jgi:lipopolysaccharide/colanic/teichoic acid biosynthesis glycosyltransferase
MTANGTGSRLLDLVVAIPVLVLTSPVVAAVAVLIRLRMGSPVLFRQARAGLDGETFEVVKFRTMRPAPSGDNGSDSDEARLTWLGRLLRSTSLDELPTLVNVVRGEMGLVGPRPLPVRYLPRYSHAHARRHEVRPGITGWAQANGRNALSWDEQLDMDVWYVDHKSLRLDVRILRDTVATVMRREGISADGHATRPEFQGSGVTVAAPGEAAPVEVAPVEAAAVEAAPGEAARTNGQRSNGRQSNGQHANGQHATGEHATGEHATGEHATGEHANGQHANGQHATGEHATYER